MDKDKLRAAIIATANPGPVAVTKIPGWDGVYVKPLLVKDIETSVVEVAPEHKHARNLARVLCDEHGELLFDPASEDDLKHLAGLPSVIFMALDDQGKAVNPNTAEAAELGNGSAPETALS